MPGPIYHVGATAMCPHGGQVTTISSNTRVLVSGMPAATLADSSVVAGCAFQLPGPTPSPCVTVQWLMPAARVLVNGQPVLLQTSPSLALAATRAPQGPASVTVNQTRVIAT
ncbi:MAG: hypothetical protein EA339_14955 [Rhodobacteraceae bacterium]|nr:MAG: hypothetical protein EA339_14955 [Paracoccaceae bacterium]